MNKTVVEQLIEAADEALGYIANLDNSPDGDEVINLLDAAISRAFRSRVRK